MVHITYAKNFAHKLISKKTTKLKLNDDKFKFLLPERRTKKNSRNFSYKGLI